jgi:hypothetical protein
LRSGIKSICDREDVHLYDYLYFLKKMAFVMSLLFWIYLTNFTNNCIGEYLESEDGITGFEFMTLANINGLPPMVRFESERDAGMDDVSSSRFLTVIVDFISTLIFIGIITLRVRWRIFPSDFAVKLTNIRRDYNGEIEKEIKTKFEPKYGKIHEIAVIKDAGDILHLQMKLNQITIKIGDAKAKNNFLGQDSSKELFKLYKQESAINEQLAREIKKVDDRKLEVG